MQQLELRDESIGKNRQRGSPLGSLARLNKARRELALLTRIDEIKGIRDRAEALRMYCRQAGESLEMQNDCAEIKIRAERRAGELLTERGRRKGETDKTILCHRRELSPTLKELGIEAKQSMRWQTIAGIPVTVFEAHIETTRAKAAELTTADLLRLARRQQRRRQQKKYGSKRYNALPLSSLPAGHYGTVYADPPWPYDNQGTRAAASYHYPTMSIDDICRLPVSGRVKTKAHLWLWTTNSFLREAFDVVDAWGFEYKSAMVWAKPQLGLGNYVRVSHELLLIASRGNLAGRATDQRSWLEHDRMKHSAKPEVFRQVIEEISPGPYLELFARTKADGWDSWGNGI
jgi:N6-adenosine-specific RNA methylase IME4